MWAGETIALYLYDVKRLLQQARLELAQNACHLLLLHQVYQDCWLNQLTALGIWEYKRSEYSSSVGQDIDGHYGTRTNCRDDHIYDNQ